MKIRLEALSGAEGIGIVLANGQLRLLQPPYSAANTSLLPKGALQDAITKYGFSACEREFDDWAALIAYLDGGVAAARRSLGMELPGSIDRRALLEVAPPEILMRYLDRVPNELIPHRKFDPADDLLLALLTSDAVKAHTEIWNRAVALLQESKTARKKSEARRQELATQDIRFQSLQDPGELEWSSQMAEKIRERGCVFA